MDPLNNTQNTMPNSGVPVQKSGTGALIGAVIIIILLAIGALYLWGAKLNEGQMNPPPLILGNDEAAEADFSSDASAGLPPQQTSDEAGAISADLEAMNMNQLSSQTSSSAEAFGSASAQ